ncbi:MAG: hypothetical protein WBE77_04815, partial [Candidatus Cybelea sp.]
AGDPLALGHCAPCARHPRSRQAARTRGRRALRVEVRGGGGGGGYYGGGGGGTGGCCALRNGFGSGGGGGGGSSFVEKSATDVQFTRGGGPAGNGKIVISW